MVGGGAGPDGPMASRAGTLTEIRAEIDAMDGMLLELLNRRAGAAMELGRLKEGLLPESSGLRLKDREAAVLEHLSLANGGPLPNEAIAAIFEEIFKACLDVQVRPVGGAGPQPPRLRPGP
jgi:chorismate mutase/prephenate dehydratase